MQIEHAGITNSHAGSTRQARAHKGLYIATGKGGHKVLFKPGVNSIAPEDWAKVKDSAGVVQRLKSGHLVIREDDSGDGNGKRFDFAALSVREQADLIERTIDLEVLRDWKRRSKGLDPDIAAALAGQIVAMTTDARGNPVEQKKIVLAPIRMAEGLVNAPDGGYPNRVP
jgi:hypothetical protein